MVISAKGATGDKVNDTKMLLRNSRLANITQEFTYSFNAQILVVKELQQKRTQHLLISVAPRLVAASSSYLQFLSSSLRLILLSMQTYAVTETAKRHCINKGIPWMPRRMTCATYTIHAGRIFLTVVKQKTSILTP